MAATGAAEGGSQASTTQEAPSEAAPSELLKLGVLGGATVLASCSACLM